MIVVLSSLITKSQVKAVSFTLTIDVIAMMIILLKYIDSFCLKFEILKNMKYVSNDIFKSIGMFIIYLIGWKNTLEFGAMYLVAINFETLTMDAQWDMSYSVITAATIDSSKDKLNYKESLRNSRKLVGLLILSSLIM